MHCQVLAALFGDTLHGPTRASDDGRIIGPIGAWARVVEDLCSLREGVDGGGEFCDDVDGRWLRLFCRTLEAERFRRFAASEIRAQETPVRIFPPGHDTAPEHDPSHELWRGVLLIQSLGYAQTSPTTWACSFPERSPPTPVQTAYPRSPAGSPPLITSLVPNSIGQCPMNRNAHSHISHGRCTALQCRICHEWSTDVRLHQHVRIHLPNPRPVIKTFWCRKHLVICASHADRQHRGIERGILMAAHHHHRHWRRVISRTHRAQQHRTWEASLLDTFYCQKPSQTAFSMKQAGRAYHQEV